MNEKFDKNAYVEQLTKTCLSREEEKGLIVKDPSWKFDRMCMKGLTFHMWNFIMIYPLV